MVAKRKKNRPAPNAEEIDTALLEVWRQHAGGDEIGLDDGNGFDRTCELLGRAARSLTWLHQMLLARNPTHMAAALDSLDKLDPKHTGTCLGDVVEDAFDLLEALKKLEAKGEWDPVY